MACYPRSSILDTALLSGFTWHVMQLPCQVLSLCSSFDGTCKVQSYFYWYHCAWAAVPTVVSLSTKGIGQQFSHANC